MDPELGISIVDLGLIYKVEINDKGVVKIKMTLTTAGCPLAGVIEGQIKEALMELKGVSRVEVSFTFDPPWNQGMMSEEAKAVLGF